ncbi:shikimate dehydrogenase [Slackia piriformis]|uniref:shikimate dehydrogenase n=1 Tax=Slackia piriformis TaxID=626934 RepID=UPI0039F54584
MGEKTRISGHTHLISLLGSPVAHSSSPATHNLSFEKLGVDAAYLVFDVKEDGVERALEAMKTLGGWDGSNVTMPCKRAVIPYLDELDPAAELMNAVNVINCKDGKLKGYNTDGVGFMTNLRKHGVQDKDAVMTLVGLGGAGTAILTQAALDGVKTIFAFARSNGPSYERAKTLIPRVAEKTGCNIELRDLDDVEDLKARIAVSSILVNATNVGMGKDCNDTLIPAETLRPDLSVADVIYYPLKTRLILDAENAGCAAAVTGIGMMLEQAAAGEKIWFDIDMPTDEIAAELFS